MKDPRYDPDLFPCFYCGKPYRSGHNNPRSSEYCSVYKQWDRSWGLSQINFLSGVVILLLFSIIIFLISWLLIP